MRYNECNRELKEGELRERQTERQRVKEIQRMTEINRERKREREK